MSAVGRRSVSPKVASSSLRKAEKSSKSHDVVSTKGANNAYVGPCQQQTQETDLVGACGITTGL